MKIFWDRGGRNVGRFQRFIYVEWEDPEDPYNRLLIDITHFADDYIERDVLPHLPEYFRRVPPLRLRHLSSYYFRDENEFLEFNKIAKPFPVVLKAPYSLIDYTPFWKRVRGAALRAPFLLIETEELGDAAVEVTVGAVARVEVPRAVYEAWLTAKRILEETLRRIEEIERKQRAAAASGELVVKFD